MLNPNDHMLEFVDGYLHGALSSFDAQTLEVRSQQRASTLGGKDLGVKRRAQGQSVDESGKGLGLGLGIETRAQLDMLREVGCDLGQGYYFAAPMDGDADWESAPVAAALV